MKKGTGGFVHPEKIIKELDIKKGMKIADFGCGAGYYAIPMAKIVGESGKIYALDVLKTALESVKSRAKERGLLNIKTIWSNLEILRGSRIEDKSIDLVLLANILFQSSQKSDIIKEVKRILKGGGKMIVIEWLPDKAMGPPKNLIVPKELAKELAKKERFRLKKEFTAGAYHWGMMFIKS